MSSSHLLLGLPTILRVLILLSSPGCQSKIFLVHLSSGREQFFLPFATSVFCVFQSNMVSSFSHVFLCFFGTPFDVFNPVFFFGRVNCFINVILEGHITVVIFVRILIPSSVSLSVTHLFSSSACLSVSSPFLSAAFFFLFVFSFCLYDKAKHLSLRSLDHFFMFFAIVSKCHLHMSMLVW